MLGDARDSTSRAQRYHKLTGRNHGTLFRKETEEKAKRSLEKGGQEAGACSPRTKCLGDAQLEKGLGHSLKEKKSKSGKIVKWKSQNEEAESVAYLRKL